MTKTALFFWVVLLSITLLYAQGLKLHVHSLEHDHQQGHVDSNTAVEHSHLSIAHLSTDVSHIEHHDEIITGSDACPDCRLTNISSKLPLIALLVVLFALALFGFYQYTFIRRRDDDSIHSPPCYVIPPLRAPPC